MIVRKEGLIEVFLDSDRGVIECIIQRIEYYGREAFEVDLWRGMPFMSQMITDFCAGAIWQWSEVHKEYKIVSPLRYLSKNTNQFWWDLEYTISCHISINT